MTVQPMNTHLFTIFTWLTTIASLIGVILNIKHDRRCFYIWFCTNSAWTFIDFYSGLYAQAMLFSIYTILALWGIYSWRKYGTKN